MIRDVFSIGPSGGDGASVEIARPPWDGGDPSLRSGSETGSRTGMRR